MTLRLKLMVFVATLLALVVSRVGRSLFDPAAVPA